MHDEALPVECGYVSPASVSNGVQFCAPARRLRRRVLTRTRRHPGARLLSAWERTLNRYPATGIAPGVVAQPEPQPLGLELADGHRCELRDGGSWPNRDDDDALYGAYSCDAATDGIVWVHQNQPEIDRSHPTWTVRIGTSTGPLATVAVTTAYLAGTAN